MVMSSQNYDNGQSGNDRYFLI